MPKYDYIIIGAGASGLLLADAIGKDKFFEHKKVLLLDKLDKTQNDRTWCFWENNDGPFDSIIYREWPKIHCAGKELNVKLNISPYSYKMIRGIDFYKFYLSKIQVYPNIEFQQDEISHVEDKKNCVLVHGENKIYESELLFDSRFDYQKLKAESRYPVLQQHFLGWFVKTKEPTFDKETASFMDFSVPQKGNTRFMYVLPFSATEALVEYTLFSENVLEKLEYEAAINDYLIQKLGITSFEVNEIEQGNIPMTCHDFSKENTDSVLKIGIAGGWAKASTGYTFYSSFKKVRQLVEFLKSGKDLSKFSTKNRFWYYDLLLLDILHKNNELGQEIFESLLSNRNPQLIFKFLDEETSLIEDIKVMASPKPWPFIKALLGRLLS